MSEIKIWVKIVLNLKEIKYVKNFNNGNLKKNLEKFDKIFEIIWKNFVKNFRGSIGSEEIFKKLSWISKMLNFVVKYQGN